MTQEEKDKLISLFDAPQRWCHEVDARDVFGDSVPFDDEKAVAWDIVGALCHLFGWVRACELFIPVGRHFVGPHLSQLLPNPNMVAMGELQEFNDHADTTFELLIAKLRQMPVWLEALPGNKVIGTASGGPRS